MPTINCPLCRRTIETGPEHCPHCHIRLPGAPPVAKPRATSSSPGSVQRLRPRAKSSGTAVQLQCPACAHPITRTDEWCKWCKWPVNR